MGYGKTICTCKLCNGKTVHVDTARKHARNWKRKREAEIDAEENISTEIAIAIDGKNDADIAIDTAFDANDDADHDESKALNSAPDSDLESDPDPEANPTSQSTLLAAQPSSARVEAHHQSTAMLQWLLRWPHQCGCGRGGCRRA